MYYKILPALLVVFLQILSSLGQFNSSDISQTFAPAFIYSAANYDARNATVAPGFSSDALSITIKTEAPTTQVTILYTNNINGALENCICPEHPLGSMEKMKVQIDRIRRQEKNVLVLDSGDLLFPFGDAARDSFALQAAALIKYDAMTIGDQELVGGIPFFIRLAKRWQLPYISANLFLKEQTPWKPYWRKKLGNLNILIVAVTSAEAFKYINQTQIENLIIKESGSAIEFLLNSIAQKNELFILLSHNGLDSDKKIAEEFKSIDLIIGAHTQDTIKTAVKVKNTLIVQSGSEGYYLGRLDLELNSEGNIVSAANQLIPMHIDLPNDSLIAEVVKTYHFPKIQNQITKNKLLQPQDEKYLCAAPEKCMSCHASEFNHWKTTAHARSWQSVTDKKKTRDVKCISCHVSGFGRRDGFININLTKELALVSCTECHALESRHLKQPRQSKSQKIQAAQCQRCHDQENDAQFDFTTDLAIIKHPSGKK